MDPLFLIVFLGIPLIFVTLSIKGVMRRNRFFKHGEQVEAEIIGVAKPRTILAIGGVQPEPGAFGMHNTTSQRQDEKMGRARVKVAYIDPVTKTREIRHVSLNRQDFTSVRIAKTALPGMVKLNSVTVETIRHNQRLLSEYSQKLDARNLSPEKKRDLLNKAGQAMEAVSGEQDNEGYVILNPPVTAVGYRLDGRIRFRESGKDTAHLHDWTKDLE